jgi:hypothetical protein
MIAPNDSRQLISNFASLAEMHRNNPDGILLQNQVNRNAREELKLEPLQ